ncbi:cytochrome P450 [Streptomyces rubrogriseus]|uniref:cytochrome P450 n=1 Tax=Streptomyces rubrogriseus TaxID=194673 RepID=UPI0037CD512A
MDVHSAPVPPPGCPAHDSGARVPLYGPDFAADPQAYYDHLRSFGPTAPVELAPGVEATLVTDYTAALNLVREPAFRKDARRWRDLHSGRVPADSPVVPLLAYRPNCMFADGAEHERLRRAVTDSMARIDSRRLARITEQVSAYLIAQFGSRGSADLMADYARQLPLFVFNELFGCSADIGDRVLVGIAGMFDGVDAAESARLLYAAVGELAALKREQPGDDVTSWLMEHEAGLTDDEMVHQLSLLLGAGAEPLRNLIGNTLHRILTRDRGAYQDVRDAVNDTLWKNPPIANFAAHYPAEDRRFAGRQVRAGELMLVGFAAANVGMARTEGHHTGNRASLAWSAGPHACPSQRPATGITVTAVENLLGRLPDVELAVPEALLTWRPGPFHRALNALPVRFGAVRAMEGPTAPVPPQRTAARVEHSADRHSADRHGAGGPGKWSQFLAWLRK